MKKINLIILLSALLFSELPTLSDMLKSKPIIPYHKQPSSSMDIFYQGRILEILHAKPYTYIKLAEIHPDIKKSDNNIFWIATNELKAQEGDIIRFKKEMLIKKFTSEVLKKEFHNLIFASEIEYRVE